MRKVKPILSTTKLRTISYDKIVKEIADEYRLNHKDLKRMYSFIWDILKFQVYCGNKVVIYNIGSIIFKFGKRTNGMFSVKIDNILSSDNWSIDVTTVSMKFSKLWNKFFNK